MVLIFNKALSFLKQIVSVVFSKHNWKMNKLCICGELFSAVDLGLTQNEQQCVHCNKGTNQRRIDLLMFFFTGLADNEEKIVHYQVYP